MAWPRRGVYFFFEPDQLEPGKLEPGELEPDQLEPGEVRRESGARPRVARVGTHALKSGALSTLWGRLGQHKGTTRTGGGNHRASIFRLLVGTALIERDGYDCAAWGRGSSAPRAVRDGEVELERQVSKEIGAMPFLWLRVDDETGPGSLRGFVERNVIAMASNWDGAVDPPSTNWLGHHCLREKVRRSGLWNQNHVDDRYDPMVLDVIEALVTEQCEREERE